VNLRQTKNQSFQREHGLGCGMVRAAPKGSQKTAFLDVQVGRRVSLSKPPRPKLITQNPKGKT